MSRMNHIRQSPLYRTATQVVPARGPYPEGAVLPPRGTVATARERMAAMWLWIMLVGVVFRVTVFMRRQDSQSYASMDSYAIIQIAMFGFMACLLLWVSHRVGRVLATLSGTSYALLMAYYGIGLTSTLWSPMPLYTAYRACEVIVLLLAIPVAVSCLPDFRSAERRVMAVAFLVVMCSTIATIRFAGFTLSREDWHSNGMPASAGILFCYCCGELMAGRRDRAALVKWAVASGAFVLIGTSSASILSCSVGFLTAAILTRNVKVVAIIIMVAGLGLIVGGSETLQAFLFPGKSTAAISNLSGRAYLWSEFWERIKESPYIGHGLSMLARTGTVYATNCHNSVLAVLGGTGFLGGAVFAAWLGKRVMELFADVRRMPVGSVGCAAAFTAGFCNSMGLAFLGEDWQPATVTFLCFLALYALRVGPRRCV